MKKRLFLVLSVLLTTLSIQAADGDTFTANTVEGVEMTFKVISEEAKTCLVGEGSSASIPTSTSGAVTIPATANGYSVKTITHKAFYNCSSLTSITIPKGVTSIGNHAFYGCKSLESANIPEGVTSIGTEAFANCISLTSITIPESMTIMSSYAFSFCSGLTNIVVEDGNKAFDSRNGCNAIIKSSTNELIVGCKNTVIPKGVTSIANRAFFGCSSLTSITIPEGVKSIGNSAFNSCRSLTSITIPESVTNFGDNAFRNCSLTSITIPEGVTTIGDDAFYGCSDLTIITSKILEPFAVNCFQYTTTNATLYVPKGTVEKYKATDGWKEFKTIKEIKEYDEHYDVNRDGKIDVTDVTLLIDWILIH